MNRQTIVDDWKANAERNLDRNFKFIHRLKMKSDNAVDRMAHRLHEEAFSIIDCTQCANCCKTSSPLFRKSDVRRIAEHLGVKLSRLHGDVFEGGRGRRPGAEDAAVSLLGNRQPLHDLRGAASGLCGVSTYAEERLFRSHPRHRQQLVDLSGGVLHHRTDAGKATMMKRPPVSVTPLLDNIGNTEGLLLLVSQLVMISAMQHNLNIPLILQSHLY